MENGKISTTLYVNTALLERIKTAAEIKNISSNKIITTLLRKTLSKHKDEFKLYHPVKYQKKDPNKRWKRHHVRFDGVDYELFTDQRKFYKTSVSLLLFFAVERFLNDLLKNDKDENCSQNSPDSIPCNLDNYLPFFYKITYEIENDHLIWHTFWHKSLLTRKNE